MLTTGATVGIALGAAALFLGAIALFVLYCLKQKKYDREDKAPPPPFASAQKFYYNKGPGSGPASIATSNNSYALPQYTADYKSQVGAAVSVSETPEPLPPDYSSNAEYYDRLEGKTRGRPLRTISSPAQPAAIDSLHHHHHNHNHEQVDTIGQLPTTALPTHPAYIPRSSSRNSNRATPQPGSRPSRNPTPTSVRSSTQSSSLRPQHNGTSTTNNGSGSRPDSYAIQVYLNAAEDPKVPQPPPPVAAPSWSSSHLPPRTATPASNAEIARNIQVELASFAQPTPPASAASVPQGGGRATPAPELQSQQQHISRTTSPDHTTDVGGSPLPPPPRIGSLILPSVPRIRVPNKKPLKLVITGASLAEKITGPLAFPDSRFSTPPPPAAAQDQDRIIEQTVDRGGRSMEVAIGSGKSYLYG